jgi:hypothetical protein
MHAVDPDLEQRVDGVTGREETAISHPKASGSRFASGRLCASE